ncbi:MAG: TetR/AcrR family transcriptional regulator [Hyphomicrobium sp.]
MARYPVTPLQPRKAPVQARSAITVQAICEATLQVLLNNGGERLTTTRVAERAGVSVGTLYQYYPNKQSLLFAVLDSHMKAVSEAVEAACERTRGKRMAETVRAVVEAFVDAKMKRPEVSTALYRIASEVGGPALARRTLQRSLNALHKALKAAPDAGSGPDRFTVQMMFGTMLGTTKSVLDGGASKAKVRNLRRDLLLLCQSYVTARAGIRRRATSPPRRRA